MLRSRLSDDDREDVIMESSEDVALLDDARSGDRKALAELLEKESPRIYRFGMKMCGNPSDAADVMQETLLAAARGLGEYRGSASLSTWLFSIARSHCIKKRRRSRFAPSHEDSFEQSEEALGVPDTQNQDPESALVNQELRSSLDSALAGLDEGGREVLLLRDLEGMTAPEVASVLGISVAAVKSRLHRARTELRTALLSREAADSEPERHPECPDVLDLLSRHLEDELAPGVCHEMEAHLVTCAACQSRCDSLRRTIDLCRSAPAEAPPIDALRALERELLAAR